MKTQGTVFHLRTQPPVILFLFSLFALAVREAFIELLQHIQRLLSVRLL